ncbi:flagellar MS-ring protein [Burkholderia diffusa]|uniref:Flagellar M-ring protein n=2 Tax=Burkholderia diffusa TaxID=488732 RepID=A0AAW3P8V8_9BURK|nr:flagellar MS-ring protein [Burkholderia diffusa]KWF41368.1 flagellar MS-ring protein [Burkholderia diffusa]KWF44194.1 flagellar MS-ring protein [Burkholderia diffusa]KWF45102.1 flagellar MS-ring protein [Burkholderia diffusa]KWF51085.1 flagellar MS-ring protein [Burkholderia diffusa]
MLARLKAAVQNRLPTSLAWLRLSPAVLARLMPIIVLAIALTALATLYMRYDQANYKAVFGAREPVQLDQLVTVLDAERIPYRIHPETGQVLVSSSELARARMILAAKGVTAKPAPGLEQVDNDDPLGTSQFVQDVRFRRGLESELAQSIMTMDPIDKARVHLSIARSSSFVMVDGEKSSASVVLSLRPGRRLTKEQTAAVINLVAGSVPNLAAERVSVVDQGGAFLSAHVDLTDDLVGGGDAAARARDDAMRNVQDLLAPTLGDGNFRVSVTAVVNNDRVEETREQFGEAPKVMNEATRDEQNRDRMALGVPGSLSNRPVDVPASEPRADGGTKRNATTRQFAYDRNVTQIKRSRGRLEKLSVAVVLSNAASPTKGKPWSAEQLKHIDQILRSGLGIDEGRGDQLVVSSLDFPPAPVEEPWWKQRETLTDGGWYLAYGLGALLVYLLIARPVLRMGQQWSQHKYGGAVAAEVPALANGEPGRLSDESEAATPALPDGRPPLGGVMSLLDEVDLPPADSGVEVLIDHLHALSEKEPERVAEVVKQWIQNNGNASS